MKILGVGVDIIENKRIKNLISKKLFLKRTFGKNEIRLSKKTFNKTNFYSKRFAAKEAFAKSIGTGFRNDLNLKDIEILNDKVGKPFILKSKKINNLIKKRFKINNFDLFLSISDEKDYSIAFTILQKK
jgi:holo-[acyl-carrier protein] synthase